MAAFARGAAQRPRCDFRLSLIDYDRRSDALWQGRSILASSYIAAGAALDMRFRDIRPPIAKAGERAGPPLGEQVVGAAKRYAQRGPDLPSRVLQPITYNECWWPASWRSQCRESCSRCE